MAKKVIPFDIKYRPQVESGEMKVQTKEGYHVRVICWDMIGDNPIVALVMDDGEENAILFNKEGKNILNYYNTLVLVTEEEKPELTEFERTVAEYVYAGCDLDSMLDEKTVVENIKGISQELLDLAIKQIEDELRGSIASSSKIEAAYALGCCDTEERLLKDIKDENAPLGSIQNPIDMADEHFLKGKEVGRRELLQEIEEITKTGVVICEDVLPVPETCKENGDSLTDFEKCVYDLLEAGNGEYFLEDEQMERVKEIVPDLLDLAYKQLPVGFYFWDGKERKWFSKKAEVKPGNGASLVIEAEEEKK